MNAKILKVSLGITAFALLSLTFMFAENVQATGEYPCESKPECDCYDPEGPAEYGCYLAPGSETEDSRPCSGGFCSSQGPPNTE